MPYCSNCGRKLEASDNFCEDCGKKRAGKTIEETDIKVATNEPDTKKESDTKLIATDGENKTIKKSIKFHMREVRSEIFMIRMFSAFLESIIIFLFCAIIFSLKSIPLGFGIMPTVVYFIIQFATAITDKSTINRVVIKYPDLDEKLQTAYENEKTPNVSAERLIAEVSQKLDEMHSSDFINVRGILTRISVIVFLLFFFFIPLRAIQQAVKKYLTDINIALGIILLCSVYARFFLIKILNSREKHDPLKEFKPKGTGDKSLGNTQLFCSKCNRPTSNTYVYCRYCGSKLGIDSVYEKEMHKGDYGDMATYRNSRFFYRCSKLFHGNNSARIERKRSPY